VCHCNSVTKGQITACWLAGARSVDEIADGTRATTGCGGCRSTVTGLVDWLRASDPQPDTAAPETASA
jgi:assimilatory nitrate reductase electron transfer subunit